MRFDRLSTFLTGVLVPVSALRSQENLGVGEFADIATLGAWCQEVGLDVIQLLPVNDSGSESSPYSALSAFALHPMYLRIGDLPEFSNLPAKARAAIQTQMDAVRAEHAASVRIRYRELREAKLAIVGEVFRQSGVDAGLQRSMDRFAEANPWIRYYATFKVLKTRNDQRSWKEWAEFRDPTPADIDAIWEGQDTAGEIRFHVWLQMRLEEQFRAVAEELAEAGIALKGDLPILMNEDSADVWAHRDAFITRLRAGAPPDMFTHLGQNWGLPIYNWEQLAQTDYQWWKDRLIQAAKFYSAYRIDHVLGFFRVWAIPEHNYSGLLGHFVPSVTASRNRLHATGLDDGRIRWLSEPHLSGEAVRANAGDAHEDVLMHALQEIGNENLYLFRDTVSGERDLQQLPLPQAVIDWLSAQYVDRALIRVEHDHFAPTWNFRNCSRYQQLSDQEKNAFETMVTRLGVESEVIWEAQARELLGFMCETTEMLVCAEDLGVIPSVVPRVLSDLGMLSLRIPRWARLWDQPEQPFIPPSEYPFLSVCAPSVHDTSTMRGWWEEESQKDGFWSSLGLPGSAPENYDAQTAREVVGALLKAGSALCVLQLQDILALTSQIPVPPSDEERVNVPGTVNDFNWNYRLPVTLSELTELSDLTDVFAEMVRRRRSQRGVPQ